MSTVIAAATRDTTNGTGALIALLAICALLTIAVTAMVKIRHRREARERYQRSLGHSQVYPFRPPTNIPMDIHRNGRSIYQPPPRTHHRQGRR